MKYMREFGDPCEEIEIPKNKTYFLDGVRISELEFPRREVRKNRRRLYEFQY